MESVIEIFKATALVVAPILSGGGVLAYMTARHKAKQAAPAQMLASHADLVTALNAQTKILLDENAADRNDLKLRIDRQETKVVRLEGQVAECQHKHSDCETSLAEVRAQIDRMMRRGTVATYPHGGANAAD